MTTQRAAQSRSELLKLLREEHSLTIERTLAYFKEQKRIQQEICKVIREKPKTVPEVSTATSIPTQDVLWQLTALKKYGQVVETGMCGDYPLYQLVVEEK
jgi:predicted transcriptional regulator